MKVTVVRENQGFVATAEQIQAMFRALLDGTMPNVSLEITSRKGLDPAVSRLLTESENLGNVREWLDDTLQRKLEALGKEGKVRVDPDSRTPGGLSNLVVDIQRKWYIEEGLYYVRAWAQSFSGMNWDEAQQKIEQSLASHLQADQGLVTVVSGAMAVIEDRFLVDLDPVVNGIKSFLMNERFQVVTGTGLAGGCLFYSQQNRNYLPDLLILNTPELKVVLDFVGVDTSDKQSISAAGSRLSGLRQYQNPDAVPMIRFEFTQEIEHSTRVPLFGENKAKANELVEKLVGVLEGIELPDSL